MLFALTLIPLIGLAGAAIDYTHASSVDSELESALDSTSLAMSKIATSQTPAQLQTAAQTFFASVFKVSGVTMPTVTATYTPATNGATATVLVSASGTVSTSFMGLLGVNSITVSGSSTSTWGNTRLRVALALDNTGSMASSGKLSALKTATKNLLTMLQTAAVNTGDVYVSIVPFAKVVNIGTANVSASWIDWTSWNSDNQTCIRKSCTTLSHNNWDGSIMDRTQNYDIMNTTPATSNTSTLFPADQGSSLDATPLTMLPLTYDWNALTAEVNNMVAGGGTNQAIGLTWGWQSLTSGNPLNAPAEDSLYQYSHVVIILSDGLNTEDRWYGNGVDPAPQVDARQATLCTNMKAAGVTIWAVQVNTDGSPLSTVLQNCASDAGKFYMLTSSGDIITTFNTIGANLSNLRISK